MNDNRETSNVLRHIIMKNKIINLKTCLFALESFLNIIFLFIRKFILPETILAKSVAKTTFHTRLDGKR